MDAGVVKLVSALVLFFVAAFGGLVSLRVQNTGSPTKMHLAYAFASGVLIAVAVVHMLAEASEELEGWGESFSKALGGDEAFPVGFLLFVLGFATIIIIEALLHHKLGHSHDQENAGSAREPLGAAPTEQNVSLLSIGQGDAVNAGGWAALAGLSLHSVVEGLAAGSVKDAEDSFAVLLAIACHKGFAAFALAAANMPLFRGGKRVWWYTLVIWFALSGSLGIILGMVASASVEGPTAAAITCFAAGTLLSVGINELLMPAINKPQMLYAKLILFLVGLSSMSLLAVWA